MATIATRLVTMGDLLARLGNVPPHRVRLRPAPGRATEKDLLRVLDHENIPCELVDGVLVEKPIVGYFESRLAAVVIFLLEEFAGRHGLGIVLGEAATMRILPGLMRIPDVSFLSWDKFPDRELPAEPIPDLAPNLAVEILSGSNTDEEMARKLEEYFEAGVELVWIIDPKTRTARSYNSPEDYDDIAEHQALKGGSVLPGFRLPLKKLFDKAGKRKKK